MENERLARIRLVTRRYDDMQGLVRGSMGVGFIVGAGVFVLVPGDLAIYVSVLVFLSLALPGARLAEKYYADRFGRVAQPAESRRPRPTVIGLIFGLILGLTTIAAKIAGPGYPINIFLMCASFLGWQLVRDWPLRKYLIIDVCAASMASALFVGQTPPGTDEYFVMCFAITGAAAMITGWLDHRFLVRTLPGVQDRQEPQYADTL